MNQEENTAAQAAQNQASDNIGAQQEMNNESVGKDGKPLTTECFHALLKFNTIELSGARAAYAIEISDLQKEYDDTLDAILKKEHQANLKLREARNVFEKAKEEYELTLRDLKRERNEAGRKHNIGKAEAKNHWSSDNEDIQSKRHNIFEWYRNSGGVLTGAEEGLLHPGWTRIKDGGVSNEENDNNSK